MDKFNETPVLKKRLLLSSVFLLILLYFSIGHRMPGLFLTQFLPDDPAVSGAIQMILSFFVVVINAEIFIHGFGKTAHREPGACTLVAIAAAALIIYSTFSLKIHKNDLYFDFAAVILTLETAGKLFMEISIGRTYYFFKNLMKHLPKTAVIVDQYDREKEIPAEKIKSGDIFVLRPGDIIPADGKVVEGNSAVDESALTGRTVTVSKNIGDEVCAATINKSGFIKCRATRIGKDTTLSRIIQIVSDSSATKPPVGKIAARVNRILIPAVIAIAALTFIIWMLLGENAGFALLRAVSVLVISAPFAIELATPVAIMAGNSVGAGNGILYRNADALENAGKTRIIALEKTGTITRGEPEVTDVFTADSVTRSGYSLINNSENELLKIAGLLEKKSRHPLAKAVVAYVGDIRTYLDDIDEDDRDDITDFEVLPGYGLKGKYQGRDVTGASFKYVTGIVHVQPEVREKATGLSMQGKTPLCFARDNKLLGIIALSDSIRDDADEAVKELKNMGIHTLMLTGDNHRTAMAVGDEVGVDEIVSEILPADKEKIINKLTEFGHVAMVGDGITDAAALSRSDTAIAIGAGTDFDIDVADIILMKGNLRDVGGAIRLSRAVMQIIRQNLGWGFLYNLIAIPIAAGVFIRPLGLQINPALAAAVMMLSCALVIANSLRLNHFNVLDASKDRPADNVISKELLTDYKIPE